MVTYKTETSDFINVEIDGKARTLLSSAAWDRFNTSLLGVGDLTEEAKSTDAIAAVFDLEGFTNFCKQIEPHLSVPSFLNEFLSWLFDEIKKVTVEAEYPEGFRLYSPLPFFVKFMGDGLLVLWDCSDMGSVRKRNIIVLLNKVCQSYSTDFSPQIRQLVAETPTHLRCGIARGTVFSVGNGNDFVGSCINMAARIQKLPGARFAFNRRGFDLTGNKSFFEDYIVVRRVAIRGIGENELIGIRKAEFEEMTAKDRELYRDP